jgi:hypothetical protein
MTRKVAHRWPRTAAWVSGHAALLVIFGFAYIFFGGHLL